MLEYLHNVWQQQAGADLELGFSDINLSQIRCFLLV